MEQTSNICLLLLTHKMNSNIQRYIEVLRASSNSIVDLYL